MDGKQSLAALVFLAMFVAFTPPGAMASGSQGSIEMPAAPIAPRLLANESVIITSPANSTMMQPNWFDLTYTVTNFTLNASAIGNSTNKPGEGHTHIFVDGAYVAFNANNSFRVTNLTYGNHAIKIELRNNDHTPLTPAVWDQIWVEVVSPTVKIDSPANTTGLMTNWTNVMYSVTNFTLNGSAIGMNNSYREGHVHILVDGVYVGFSAATTVLVKDLTYGLHAIRIELHNNNHSAVTPMVYDWIAVDVITPAVKITAPANNTQLSKDWVDLSYNVTNFTMNGSAIGKNNTFREGHVHIFVDGTYIGNTAATTFKVTNLTYGSHVLKVALHNNNHSALMPARDSGVAVNLPSPMVKITMPANNSKAFVNWLDISYNVTNLKMNGSAIGKNNSFGEGHVHLFVDGTYVGNTAATSFKVTNLTLGMRNLKVEIRNNNHSALNPPVFDWINVMVVNPTVKITSPANNTKITTNSFDLKYSVSNFTMNGSAIGKNNTPGEGHVHIFVDGIYIGNTAATIFKVTNLTLGTHQVKVALHNNNHSAFDPATFDWINVEYVLPAPVVSITSPANNTKLSTNMTNLVYAVTGLKMKASAIGGANKPGEGHVHILVDGTYAGATAASNFTVKDLKDGKRVLTVELHNNDHSPLSPNVAASITVDVDTVVTELKMLQPVTGTTYKSADVKVEFHVKGFALNGSAVGKPNKMDEGHIHLIVDGKAPILIWNGTPATYLLKLTAGQHLIKGMLVNNDHSAVAGVPEVSATITVEITGTVQQDNTMLYVGLLAVILIVIVVAVLAMRRKRGSGASDVPDEEPEKKGEEEKEEEKANEEEPKDAEEKDKKEKK